MLDDLKAEQKQRGPGCMLFLCVSSFNGGSVFEPHIVQANQNVTSDYYVNSILKETAPRIEAAVLVAAPRKKWAWMQDLATSHAAKATLAHLAERKVARLPWFPSGADANPLDIFVWPSIKAKLQAKPKEQYNAAPKLQATLLAVIATLRADPEWVGQVEACCKGVPQRLGWIAENGGKQIMEKSHKKNE